MKSQFDICILHCLEATVTGDLQTGGFSKGGIVTLKKAPSILFGSGAFLLNKNPKRIKKRVLFWRFRSPIQKPADCKWGGNWNGEAVASQHCEISYFILGSTIECTLNICISGTSLVQLLRCNLNFITSCSSVWLTIDFFYQWIPSIPCFSQNFSCWI